MTNTDNSLKTSTWTSFATDREHGHLETLKWNIAANGRMMPIGRH